MAKLVFDADGTRKYEMGTADVAIFPKTTKDNAVYYGAGFAFNGATGIEESPSGAEETALWADNIKYGSLTSNEEFSATLSAYQSPVEFDALDGTKSPVKGVNFGQQARKRFGMAYKTKVGNDMDQEAGYKLHLVYNGIAAPSSKSYSTVNDSPDTATFSWEISTTAVAVGIDGYKPVSTIVIDSTELDEAGLAVLKTLETQIYGQDASTGTTTVSDIEPHLPLPSEVYAMFAGTAAA